MVLSQGLEFYSRHKGKTLKYFQQRRDMTPVSSWCGVENGWEERTEIDPGKLS